MDLFLRPEILAVCQLPTGTKWPAPPPDGSLFSITAAETGLTVVCRPDEVPWGARVEPDRRSIKLVRKRLSVHRDVDRRKVVPRAVVRFEDDGRDRLVHNDELLFALHADLAWAGGIGALGEPRASLGELPLLAERDCRVTGLDALTRSRGRGMRPRGEARGCHQHERST